MPHSKPNILFISRNFPPLTGGMERLLYKTHESLSDEFNCILIGPRGASESINSFNKIYECRFNIASFIPCSILKSYSAASKIKFDLIFAGSGLNALPAMIISKTKNIPYITYTHGLDISYKNPLYQKFFLTAIKSSDLVIANSRHTAELATEHHIDSKKIIVLNPGVETSMAYNKNYDITKRLNIKNKKILLTVGRLVKRKGISSFIRQCLPTIVNNHPDALYLIVGDEPKKATKKDSVLEDIRRAIQETSLHNHVMILGKLNDDELISAYYQSTLFIFPVLEDPIDVEGFGMVAIEAAANGTPTIAFSSGGIPDAVKDNVSGILVPPNDYITMTHFINKYLRGEITNITKEGCRHFAEQFSWKSFKRKITEICNDTIRKNIKDLI